MTNIIGDDVNNLIDIYNNQNFLLHLYGKKNTEPGRKMGHYDKGHLSQKKSEEKGNIVPMCVECNNWALEVEFKMYGLIARPIMKK